MMMKHFFSEVISWRYRPFIFAFVITTGFTLLMIIRQSLSDLWYVIGALLLYCVLLIELYVTSNHYHIFHRKHTHKLYDFEHHASIQFAHHLVLPSMLFITFSFFIFFNQQPSQYFVLLIFIFGLFGILFENIFSFYRHKFSLHKSTMYIYDIITGFTAFLLVSTLLYLQERYVLNTVFLLLLFIVFYGLLITLLTSRNSITRKEIVVAIIHVVTAALLFMLLGQTSVTILFISYLHTMYYFAYNLFVNFYIERIITQQELLDFALVLMLSLTLLQFTN